MFEFISIGAKIDNEIDSEPRPYVFQINGQNHHKTVSLYSVGGNIPKFAQLYIYDTENDVNNKIRALKPRDNPLDIDCEIVDGNSCKCLILKIRLLELLEWLRIILSSLISHL